MEWSRHRHAARWLVLVSFTESSFFIVPPDVILAPMALACPSQAWHYAALTTVVLVFGGLFGYWLGALAFNLIEPLLHQLGYWDSYLKAHLWFEHWGGWAVLATGFTPIPYKVFTLSAGVAAMPLASLYFSLPSRPRGPIFSSGSANALWGSSNGSHITEIY
jgi:membrane protein YqaA with SNARE-associated domain